MEKPVSFNTGEILHLEGLYWTCPDCDDSFVSESSGSVSGRESPTSTVPDQEELSPIKEKKEEDKEDDCKEIQKVVGEVILVGIGRPSRDLPQPTTPYRRVTRRDYRTPTTKPGHAQLPDPYTTPTPPSPSSEQSACRRRAFDRVLDLSVIKDRSSPKLKFQFTANGDVISPVSSPSSANSPTSPLWQAGLLTPRKRRQARYGALGENDDSIERVGRLELGLGLRSSSGSWIL